MNRYAGTMLVLLALAAVLAPAAAPAQGTPADSAARAARRAPGRDWLSDRVPVRVGDVLTVVVDEKTTARERVSQNASGDRQLKGTLRADLDDDNMRYGVESGLANTSRDLGEANRSGGFATVIAVRVTAIEPPGLLRVEGSRKVTIDGRLQEITLTGLVRPEDVSAGHVVESARIADASLGYKGKKIGPRTGLFGRLLGMLWP